MTEKKPSPEAKKHPLKPSQYQEPGETPGSKDGLSPNGDKLKDINTAEKEIGGYNKEEPTRYGDWTSNGRCTDF